MNAKGNNFDYYLKCIPRHDFNTGMSLFLPDIDGNFVIFDKSILALQI